jgi:hypothetical protein
VTRHADDRDVPCREDARRPQSRDHSRFDAKTAKFDETGRRQIKTIGISHDVTLIRYDNDFEIAAEVIPFRHRWVLERGAI